MTSSSTMAAENSNDERFQKRAPQRFAVQDQPLLQRLDEQRHEHRAEAVDPVGVIPRVGPYGVVVGHNAEEAVHKPAVGHLEPMPQDAAQAEADDKRAPEIPRARREVAYLVFLGQFMYPEKRHGCFFSSAPSTPSDGR